MFWKIPHEFKITGTMLHQSYDMSNIRNGGGNHRRFVRVMCGHQIVVEKAYSSKRKDNEREKHLPLALD